MISNHWPATVCCLAILGCQPTSIPSESPSVALELVAPPQPGNGSLTQEGDAAQYTNATSQFSWRISSASEEMSPAVYTINTNHLGAVPTPARGTAILGANVETSLDAPCDRQVAYQVVIEVSVAEQTIRVPWTVRCTFRRTVNFDITNVRLRSSSADQSGETTYTAPPGYSIVEQKIHFRSRMNAGTSVRVVTQPDQLSYEHEVVLALMESIRAAAIAGDAGAGDARATQIEEFLRSNYRLRADTHASVTYAWYADSEFGRYGAENDSYARITIESIPTASDVERATALIKAAMERGEGVDVLRVLTDALVRRAD